MIYACLYPVKADMSPSALLKENISPGAIKIPLILEEVYIKNSPWYRVKKGRFAFSY